ncbi:RNA polymerase sigma factor [Xylanibacillus composti]|uniref:RNA polymerase sigma factor n=2 Tax=Xylanibacillus composti TaxID=1572762 RepID=A0A8J4H3J9_9BACL|nr:RNA polymerase sigma factor [Xylanibacillus composti]GIQ70318.1 RNA polymerase sigma factor [Xylanibacillus composti]
MMNQSELLDRLYAQMIAVSYRIMGNKSDALDIVQESWLKIIQKYETLQDPDKLFHWASTIVRRTAVNEIRRREIRRKTEGRWVRLHMPLNQPDNMLKELEWQEWMDALDDETRRMFKYKYDLGLKDLEIAERLGMPTGTVKARLHRGKRQLMKYTNMYHSRT